VLRRVATCRSVRVPALVVAVGLLCSRLCAVAEMRLLKGRGCVSSRCLLGVTCDRVSGMGADRAGATVSGAWLYLPDCRVLINRGIRRLRVLGLVA
jgi:hypothetical protein